MTDHPFDPAPSEPAPASSAPVPAATHAVAAAGRIATDPCNATDPSDSDLVDATDALDAANPPPAPARPAHPRPAHPRSAHPGPGHPDPAHEPTVLARLRMRVRLLLGLRIIVPLHLTAVLLQAMSAGFFFSGHADAVPAHEMGARLLGLIALTQAGLALLFWRRGGGPGWFVFASVALLVAEGLQIGAGYGRVYWLHVPLGVLLFGGLTRQQIWLLAEPLVPERRHPPADSPIGA